MKKLLLLFFVGTLFSSAQVLTIPDPTFKSFLLWISPTNTFAKNFQDQYVAIDTNQNGEIEVAEALLIKTLYISTGIYSPANFVGLQGFANLEILSVDEGTPGTFDFKTLTHLQTLSFSLTGPILNPDFSNMTQLKQLEFRYGCSDNSTIPFSVAGCTSLEKFVMGGFTNNAVDLSTLSALKDLTYLYGNFTGLSQCTQLTKLKLQVGQTDPNYYIYDFNNILANLTQLQTLSIDGFDTQTIDLSHQTVLTNLKISSCRFKFLDVSHCGALTVLDLQYNDQLKYVNCKNGVNQVFGTNGAPNWSGLTSLVTLCCDVAETSTFRSMFPTLPINAFCSADPGGNFNTLAGTVRYDFNANGCDATDSVYTYTRMKLTGGGAVATFYSNSEGAYSAYTQQGNFTMAPEFDNPTWFTASPASATVNFTSTNNTNTQDFCVTANGTHQDAEVVILPNDQANPGYDTAYYVLVRNVGNQPFTGMVTLNYQEPVLDFVSAYPVATAINSGQLTWAVTNLMPFSTQYISVVMNLNSPVESPALNNGDALFYSATVAATAGSDETPDNNSFAYTQIVSGSFDPNAIVCLEGTQQPLSKIGDYLHYMVHFQNVGTAAARNIAVANTINTAQFDVNSIKLLETSHNGEFRLVNNRVEFYFKDINLVPQAEGYALFKIKSLSTLTSGSSVAQSANIYFDFNVPVATNVATTTFTVLDTPSQQIQNIRLTPNPTTGLLQIGNVQALLAVRVHDIQGRLLFENQKAQNTNTIDLSAQDAGLYLVELTTDSGTQVFKIEKR
jgi:hypothetical protein